MSDGEAQQLDPSGPDAPATQPAATVRVPSTTIGTGSVIAVGCSILAVVAVLAVIVLFSLVLD